MDGVAIELVLMRVAPIRMTGYVEVESPDISTVELLNPDEFPGSALFGISVGTPPAIVYSEYRIAVWAGVESVHDSVSQLFRSEVVMSVESTKPLVPYGGPIRCAVPPEIVVFDVVAT